MSNDSPYGSETGFSLVEVMVALALLTIGLLAGARLLTSGTAANVRAKTITRATVLGMEKMEQLRALSLDDPALQPSPAEALSTNVETYYDRPDGTFLRRWSIEPLPSYPDDAVAVRVAVTQTGSPGRALFETVRVRKAARAAE